jgi:hypothetical protein
VAHTQLTAYLYSVLLLSNNLQNLNLTFHMALEPQEVKFVK